MKLTQLIMTLNLLCRVSWQPCYLINQMVLLALIPRAIVSNIDGVLIQSLNFQSGDASQDATQMATNKSLIPILKQSKLFCCRLLH